MGVAPALRLGFQERVTEVRVTSVTSGLEGGLGIKFGSVGLFGWTGTPNSKFKTETRKEAGGLLLYCIFAANKEVQNMSNLQFHHSYFQK